MLVKSDNMDISYPQLYPHPVDIYVDIMST